MSHFERVKLAAADPILGLTVAFRKDARKEKVNLGVGLYKNEALKTPILECVKSAEAALLEGEKSKEYLPIDGDRLYLDGMGELVFGKENWGLEKHRIASFQTVGGTGALKMGATFLKEAADKPIWISDPTWPNHRGVFSDCGLQVENYPYYDSKNHQVNFEGMISCLEKLTPGSIVLLHAACHNPTGVDPSHEQWKMLCDLCKTKRLIPFFDFAYQGFGRGLEEDAAAIRYFLACGLEMVVAVSNAKNFSLYAERTGCLFIVSGSAEIADRISSRVKQMIRTNYSSPPSHGAKIVGSILADPILRERWKRELSEMRGRIFSMRQLFVEKLGKNFEHFREGKGMFGLTGLKTDQVERILSEYGIYMPRDGRINICGLNEQNSDAVVKALVAVTQG